MGNVEKEILWYLNKNYYVKEYRFFNKYHDHHEWGYDILNDIEKIFSYSLDVCKEYLTKWAYANDLDEKKLTEALGRKYLKTRWSPEMALDLQAHYGITSAEEQLTKLLSHELSKEIDAEILRSLSDEIKTPNELFGVVKCLGYETSELLYDAQTFKPIRRFVSANYDDMMLERQNNPFWLKWARDNL